MKSILLIISLIIFGLTTQAQETTYKTLQNIQYYSDEINHADPYINERCVLDFYFPENIENYATIVWFHGGGLTGGSKGIPTALRKQGVAIIAVNYRLSPKVKVSKCIEDAAAAVHWAFKNIKTYSGDPSLIFISGHSAGGYLANMVGLDKSWLQKYDIDADRIAGLIPFSGHAITHFTIRKESGIRGTQPIIDSFAPIYHVRPNAPPLLLITGDRELELLGRYEENAYFMRMMKVAGHQETVLYEMDGYGHAMTQPAFPLLLKEVRRIAKKKNQSK